MYMVSGGVLSYGGIMAIILNVLLTKEEKA